MCPEPGVVVVVVVELGGAEDGGLGVGVTVADGDPLGVAVSGVVGALTTGPGAASLATGALPSRAATVAGSLPSMPRAQMPTPAKWLAWAI